MRQQQYSGNNMSTNKTNSNVTLTIGQEVCRRIQTNCLENRQHSTDVIRHPKRMWEKKEKNQNFRLKKWICSILSMIGFECDTLYWKLE